MTTMAATNIEQAILTFSTIYIFWFIRVGSKWSLLFLKYKKELKPISFCWLYMIMLHLQRQINIFRSETLSVS